VSYQEQKYVKIEEKSISVFIYYNFNQEIMTLIVFISSPPSIFHNTVFFYLFPAILGHSQVSAEKLMIKKITFRAILPLCKGQALCFSCLTFYY